MKLNTRIFSIIILFCLYHYFIQNGLEKTFSQTYFDYNDVKRPLTRCRNKDKSGLLKCIGMPSGHAETSSLFFFLLYFCNFIPLWVTLIFILIVSIQRIVTNMHTISQVIVGAILGFTYASIYKYFNLSIIGFILVFIIGIILALLCIYKLDQKVDSKIPTTSKKKQDVPIYIKIYLLYLNSIIHNRTFLQLA